MTVYLFANNAHTTLAGPIASGATSLSLAAGTGTFFPTPATGQQFALTLRSQTSQTSFEIVYCTARSGDVCTVIRGQESTSPLAFLAGDFVDNFLTAGTVAAFTQASQLQQQAGNYAVDTGTTNALVITLSPPAASLGLLVGVPLRVKVANTNTASSTIAVNGLAATVIGNPDGTTLFSGQMIAGHVVELIYNGSTFDLIAGPYELLGRANVWNATNTFPAIIATTLSASTVNGTTGSFSGAVSGASGAFSGAVSGATGSFSGRITAAVGTGFSHVATFGPGTSTFTPNANTGVIKARAWAGGASGGAGTGGGGGGGGGGGEYREGVFSVTPGVGISITVGAGGVGSAGNGGDGGNTTIAGLMTAIGGHAGTASSSLSAPGLGGGGGLGGSGGYISFTGAPGQNGFAIGANAAGGTGGGSFGSNNTFFPLAFGGIAGNIWGGGSSGGAASVSASGASGLVIIEF